MPHLSAWMCRLGGCITNIAQNFACCTCRKILSSDLNFQKMIRLSFCPSTWFSRILSLEFVRIILIWKRFPLPSFQPWAGPDKLRNSVNVTEQRQHRALTWGLFALGQNQLQLQLTSSSGIHLSPGIQFFHFLYKVRMTILFQWRVCLVWRLF